MEMVVVMVVVVVMVMVMVIEMEMEMVLKMELMLMNKSMKMYWIHSLFLMTSERKKRTTYIGLIIIPILQAKHHLLVPK